MSSDDRKIIKPAYDVEGYEQTGSYTDEDEGDGKVILQLMELGADLSQARHSIHYLYFDTQAHADRACNELEKSGFAVSAGQELGTMSSELRWPVTAERTEVINEQVIRKLRELLHKIAHRHGGVYDGWEASSE